MHAMTAAHKILPMNTMLLVENLDNGRRAVVRVNDRGPFIDGRILDLSHAAAEALGILKPGTARVAIYAVDDSSANSGKIPVAPISFPQQKKGYYVQVGAFSRQGNALRMKQHFDKAGHKAIIHPTADPKNNRQLYLVQVYIGNSYQQAQKAEQVLLKKGYKGAFLLMRK